MIHNFLHAVSYFKVLFCQGVRISLLVFWQKALHWELTLEPLWVLAVVIDEMILSHPSEKSPLSPCQATGPRQVPPIGSAPSPAEPGIALPGTSINLVVPERSYEGPLRPVDLVLPSACCPAVTVP